MGYSHHVKCYLPYSSQADTIRQLLEKQFSKVLSKLIVKMTFLTQVKQRKNSYH